MLIRDERMLIRIVCKGAYKPALAGGASAVTEDLDKHCVSEWGSASIFLTAWFSVVGELSFEVWCLSESSVVGIGLLLQLAVLLVSFSVLGALSFLGWRICAFFWL